MENTTKISKILKKNKNFINLLQEEDEDILEHGRYILTGRHFPLFPSFQWKLTIASHTWLAQLYESSIRASDPEGRINFDYVARKNTKAALADSLMQLIPSEILKIIFNKLDNNSLKAITNVCHDFKNFENKIKSINNFFYPRDQNHFAELMHYNNSEKFIVKLTITDDFKDLFYDVITSYLYAQFLNIEIELLDNPLHFFHLIENFKYGNKIAISIIIAVAMHSSVADKNFCINLFYNNLIIFGVKKSISFNLPDLLIKEKLNIQLSNINLKKQNLSFIYFSNLYFYKSVFKKSNLSYAQLENSYFKEANFRKTYLKRARLKGAILKMADLTNAKLYHAYMQGANLENAILVRSCLQGAILKNANLRNANLENANMQGCILDDSDLCGVKHLSSILKAKSFNRITLFESEYQRLLVSAAQDKKILKKLNRINVVSSSSLPLNIDITVDNKRQIQVQEAEGVKILINNSKKTYNNIYVAIFFEDQASANKFQAELLTRGIKDTKNKDYDRQIFIPESGGFEINLNASEYDSLMGEGSFNQQLLTRQASSSSSFHL